MQPIFRHSLSLVLASSLIASSAFAAPQTQDPPAPPPLRTPRRHRLPRSRKPATDSAAKRFAACPAARHRNSKNSKEDVEAIGNRNVGKGVNLFSLSGKSLLAKDWLRKFERSSKLIDDPIVTEYVNRVGQNLVRNSDAKVPFTIKVIDSDEVNAFALPGGFFYVNSGLILRAQEESELAGVMAHEIAHVAARHGTKNATKGELMQLASIPAMIFIPTAWRATPCIKA